MNVLLPHSVVDWLLSLSPSTVALALFAVVMPFLISGFLKRMRSARGSGLGQDLARAFEARWQLLLLGSTGLVLSLASGYTTWMGMTNFTGERTLSLMVTFGIQGVMLIVAWLIGESFAAGMNRQPGQRSDRSIATVVGAALGVLLVGMILVWLLRTNEAVIWTRAAGWSYDTGRLSNVFLYFGIAVLVLGVVLANSRHDLAINYVQSGRIIIRNAILWVMFLACMSTSVFFSFDSLFTAIFPKAERVRAAQLRAQNQVAGIVADIGATIERRRGEEVEHLFASKGWSKYDEQLDRLSAASQDAGPAIEKYFNDQIEAKNRAIKEQQERIATANSGSAGLQTKKISLTEELSRIKAERPALAADVAEKKTELDNRSKAVDAKRVEAMAEDRGVEGTGKQGRGPVYRQRMDELAKMQDAYKIQEDRVRDATKRLTAADTRLAQIERELASVDGDLAKLKGEAETAEQRIKLTNDATASDGRPRIDPASVRALFERARVDFRQEPTFDRLTALHQQCSNLLGAMLSTQATKGKVAGIDCDPKQASEAAAVMFALNAGLDTFTRQCAGGDKLNANTTTDELYGFARKCLADSGLPSKETEELRTKINFSDLQRDDKAHPFVATLNAFHDGNYLAYLALGIAIAMDGLVFMSGLFGANAVRSPLSDVPSMKARSGKQLDAIIENALLPDTFDNARAVLNAMRPITPRDGFSAHIVLDPADPHAPEIRRVVNAAATIGAVRQSSDNSGYDVRSELFEFLSVAARRAFQADAEHARLAELRKVVTVALQPHVGTNADVVIHHCQPITEKNGFSAEVYLSRMSADDAYVVQRTLNAGATLSFVQREADPAQDSLQRYYIHKQLYKTLLLISAANPKTAERSTAPALAPPRQPQVGYGGRLSAHEPALAREPDTPRIAAPSAAEPSRERFEPALAPQPQARDPETVESLRNEYWARYLGAIGMEADVVNARLAVPGLAMLAHAAWDALEQHAQGNSRLAHLLRRHRQEQEQLLADEHEVISHEIYSRPAAVKEMLREIDETAHSYLPVLMVFPENNLLSSIIEQLERAAQGDDSQAPGEQVLKERLKNLRQNISGLDLGDAASWQQIGALISDGLAGRGGNVVHLQQSERRQQRG